MPLGRAKPLLPPPLIHSWAGDPPRLLGTTACPRRGAARLQSGQLPAGGRRGNVPRVRAGPSSAGESPAPPTRTRRAGPGARSPRPPVPHTRAAAHPHWRPPAPSRLPPQLPPASLKLRRALPARRGCWTPGLWGRGRRSLVPSQSAGPGLRCRSPAPGTARQSTAVSPRGRGAGGSGRGCSWASRPGPARRGAGPAGAGGEAGPLGTGACGGGGGGFPRGSGHRAGGRPGGGRWPPASSAGGSRRRVFLGDLGRLTRPQPREAAAFPSPSSSSSARAGFPETPSCRWGEKIPVNFCRIGTKNGIEEPIFFFSDLR